MRKKKKIREAKSFDELLDIKYGKIGSDKRDDFEEKAQYFVISEVLKEARKEANMTQEQLAEKVGTKKSYISRLENGKCDIQLSTLYRIFEFGLGKRVNLIFG
ncbi:MAG: helix-turn-helix transcriptional regulator [Bacteroidia bacterium]|nr:helix-turn-helix transcriptional regulator [Bacteroidia bacterium]MBP7713491.1 helix-turn-helix transcriptional regulator [Bacteroidia bacterium]MBP8667333.1 helix-turn-helix transcriptional regulator [Bacteroidia bacterium]HQX71229.1 helix-turn-helix transcriptional regulator [Bacteroidia bacterium]HQZ78491.1 helix-turn-helix transcriptional regulator [Bacteroidia bacterium]